MSEIKKVILNSSQLRLTIKRLSFDSKSLALLAKSVRFEVFSSLSKPLKILLSSLIKMHIMVNTLGTTGIGKIC